VEIKKRSLEKSAREIRYDFFEKLIQAHSYDNLLTAHQLNDRLEWLLMQMTRGSGLIELLSMSKIEKRKTFTLVRPLLEISKEKLIGYLKKNNIKFFLDQSNEDVTITRNYFRKNFADDLIKYGEKGIKKSFEYLEEDIDNLIEKVTVKREKKLYTFKTPTTLRSLRYYVDKILKENQILLSSAQREQILFDVEIVLSGKFVIAVTKEKTWIAPYLQVKMDKKFKEKCRIAKVPKKIRSYLFANEMSATI